MYDMAGDEGFEPPNAGTRTRCLTTWRIPSVELVNRIPLWMRERGFFRRKNPHTSGRRLSNVIQVFHLARLLLRANPRMPGPEPGALPIGESPRQFYYSA